MDAPPPPKNRCSRGAQEPVSGQNCQRLKMREREKGDRAGGVAEDGDIRVVDQHHGREVGNRLPKRYLLPGCTPHN